MSQLFESIKLKDGKYSNLSYHEERMNRSLEKLFGLRRSFNLEEFLRTAETPGQGLFKCRIIYSDRSAEIEFVPYEARLVRTLRVIEHDEISYEFKFSDRTVINQLFELRRNCDDILIVKHGMVTDSSIANIVFKRKEKWYTPRVPLLNGTMRSKLVQGNLVREEHIGLKEIYNFESFKLINAMLEFESAEQDLSNIVF